MPVQEQALAYRAAWERAQHLAMCQAAVISVALTADDFVGFCIGYLGEGEWVEEPFHVRFKGDQVVNLVVGDRSVLTGKPVLFETWPAPARAAVARARAQLRQLMGTDSDGLQVAAANEIRRIQWSRAQPDEGISAQGVLDARVWLRIPAQLGLATMAANA